MVDLSDQFRLSVYGSSPKDVKRMNQALREAEEAIEELIDLYEEWVEIGKPTDSRQLDIFWQMGKIILKYDRKYGYGHEECPDCGYKNIKHRDQCQICSKDLESDVEKKEYLTETKIPKIGDERNDLPGEFRLRIMKSFAMMFPQQAYDENLSFSRHYRELHMLRQYPEKVWRPIMEELEPNDPKDKVKQLKKSARNKFIEKWAPTEEDAAKLKGQGGEKL